MANAPTLRMLAKIAGVSKTTVSLALRDHPRIRPEVRQRIRQLAEQNGYQPNAIMANLLAQLRASRTSAYQSTLGLLCVARDPTEFLTVPTFRSWVAGCRARAAEQGYGFDEFWAYDPHIPPARLIEVLDARNIGGLAVIGFYEREALSTDFDPIWQRSAAVALGTRPTWPLIHFASNDQYVTVVQAVHELVHHGYRRPGLCVGHHIDDVVENRFSAGFWATRRRLHVNEEVPVFDFQSDARAEFARWVQSYQPDVILTVHVEVREWLAALGVQVPGDIGLLHLDKAVDSADWAGMQQNSEVIGRAALDMLIGQLHRNEVGIPPFQKSMLINSTWSPGATMRA